MMHRKFARTFAILPLYLVLTSLGSVAAAPPAPEELLPATTTEFVAIPDVNKLVDGWKQTNFAQMLQDPALQPFLNDLFDRTKGFNYLLDTIGADFDKVKAATGGELGWAVVLTSPTEVAHVLTLDTTGHKEAAQKLINDLDALLKKKGGQGNTRRLDENMLAYVIDMPNKQQIVLGIRGPMLIITDHLQTLIDIHQRWVGAAHNTLANVPAYQAVRRKSKPHDNERELIRWYFEPIARTEALMIYFPEMKQKKGDNLAQALRKEGVDAIKGVGGVIAFQSNGTDMLLRAGAHVPQFPTRGALRMATLPNNTPLKPDDWVPADLSGYGTFGIDLVNAFDCFDTLFERLCDEPPGTFKQIMKSVREDKDGPQVDIRNEIMAQLQPRITIINDALRPITPKSERFLVGIAAKDAQAEQTLIKAIHNCFLADRKFKARDYAGVRIWEMQVKEKKGKNGKAENVRVPGLCIAVARGNLFLSSHGSLLEKVIDYRGEGLGATADYQHFMNEMQRLGMGPSSARSFLRIDVGAHATYEMARSNNLEDAHSLYGLLLTKLLKDDKTGKMRVDGRKLPDYGVLTKYLGLAGHYTTTDPDGWTVVGTILKK